MRTTKVSCVMASLLMLPCLMSCCHTLQVAERAGVHVSDVKNVIIWGNHSSTQYPDVNHGTVSGKPIREVLADSGDWLNTEFITVVQQRGAAIIKVGRVDCL